MQKVEIKIPFNRPAVVGAEFDYLASAIKLNHISGDGSYTARCSRLVEDLLGIRKVLLTTSCTHALEMAALLLDIRPGDEVIVPDFTFVSTVNAFVLRGATPIFADIRPDTLNLDERHLASLITPKTKAIVPVHYAGVACEMDEILSLAKPKKIAVIEDSAHAFFGKYKGRNLGALGSLGTLSFHETKNFSCGEGGALLVNDDNLISRAEIIREKGTNRSRFFRGEVDKYTWVDLGSSYLLSDLLAAFLFAQLEKREAIQDRRKKIWEFYYQNLKAWAQRNEIQLPVVPEYCEPAYHIFHLVFPSLEMRTQMISHLKKCGIAAISHYVPLHSSEMGIRFSGDRKNPCPVSSSVSDRLLRLPLFYDLQQIDQEKVVNEILSFGLKG